MRPKKVAQKPENVLLVFFSSHFFISCVLPKPPTSGLKAPALRPHLLGQVALAARQVAEMPVQVRNLLAVEFRDLRRAQTGALSRGPRAATTRQMYPWVSARVFFV